MRCTVFRHAVSCMSARASRTSIPFSTSQPQALPADQSGNSWPPCKAANLGVHLPVSGVEVRSLDDPSCTFQGSSFFG